VQEDSFRPLELKVRSASEESISFHTSVVVRPKARVKTLTTPLNYRLRSFQTVKWSAGHGSISNILDTFRLTYRERRCLGILLNL